MVDATKVWIPGSFFATPLWQGWPHIADLIGGADVDGETYRASAVLALVRSDLRLTAQSIAECAETEPIAGLVGYQAQLAAEIEAIDLIERHVAGPHVWHAWDESGHVETYDAPTAEDAAQAYVDGGDWHVEPGSGTVFHRIIVADRDPSDPDAETETIRIAVDPEPPPCVDEDGETHDETHDSHAWGPERVRGNGGGVIIHETCTRCGVTMVTDTWAQDPTNGEQGLRSVRYLTPDAE